MTSPWSLYRLAWINLVVHLLGLALAGLAMRPGSPLVRLEDRLAYLVEQPVPWQLGWGVWMLCALSLAAFFVAASARFPARADAARLAAALAVGGASVDLLCDSVQITVLPLAAHAASLDSLPFLLSERAAGAGGLIAANGLYTLAVALLNLESRRFPATANLRLLGWGVVLAGALMATAGLLDSTLLAAVATGPTMGLFCLWTFGMAQVLETQPLVPLGDDA